METLIAETEIYTSEKAGKYLSFILGDEEYGIEILADKPADSRYDGIVLAVAHQQFIEMSIESIHAMGKSSHIVYDIKSVLPVDQIDSRL